MATALKDHSAEKAPLHESVAKKKVGIVVANWHTDITYTLAEGAKKTLLEAGLEEDNIIQQPVPGSFELPLAAQLMLEMGHMDAVIAIGCLIKGETPHFHYISESVTLTLSQLNVRYAKPVAYGVLTVDTLEQAQERAGGKHGNKGEEAADAVLQMLSLKETLRQAPTKKGIGFGS